METYTDEQKWLRDEAIKDRWIEAIRSERTSNCQAVVAEGHDVNFEMIYGGRPLILAARQGALEVCRFLLDNGANVNDSDNAQKTALHFAAANRKLDLCHLLIERGADVHARNDQSATPLHWGAASGGPDITEMLLAAGADVHAVSHGNETPLHEAAAAGSAEVIGILLAAGANAHAVTDEKVTALHRAVTAGSLASCEKLLAAGADPVFCPEQHSISYLTPFESAVRYGHVEIAKLFYRTHSIDPLAMTARGVPLTDIASKTKSMQDFLRTLLLEWSVRRAVDSTTGDALASGTNKAKSAGMSPL